MHKNSKTAIHLLFMAIPSSIFSAPLHIYLYISSSLIRESMLFVTLQELYHNSRILSI